MTRPGARGGVVEAVLDRPACALALYLVATLLLTWPLSFRLGAEIPLGVGDLWSNLWNFWWWKHALFELGASPYRTELLFHPHGVSLAFHTHSPLNVLATLPVSLAFGIEAAYGVALLAGFWLAGFFTYLLVRDLSAEPRAAFVAGLVFAFAPAHFEQSLEHLNFASVQFIPLFAFFVRRLVLRGGPANAVGVGLSLAANALVCWQYAVVAAPAGAVLALREWLAAGRRASARLGLDLAGAAFVAVAAVLPFAAPLLSEALAAGGLPTKPFDVLGTDPVFWLLPSDHNPLLGPLTDTLYRTRRAYPFAGFLSYLGLVPLGLGVLASTRWRGARGGGSFWGGWTVVFLILSLGAHPILFGRLHPEIPLPHGLFESVPLLRMLRVANRFVVFAMLGIAVLAGAGLAVLFRSGRVRTAWALSAVAMLEFLWLPYPTQPAGTHPFLEELAGGPDAGAVLPVPLPVGSRYARALYDQTRHGRPIPGGYVSYIGRRAARPIATSPFLVQAAQGERAVRLDVGQLASLGIGTVVVHLDRGRPHRRERLEDGGDDAYTRRAWDPKQGFPGPVLLHIVSQLRQQLGAPLYEDELLVVFAVPRSGSSPGVPDAASPARAGSR